MHAKLLLLASSLAGHALALPTVLNPRDLNISVDVDVDVNVNIPGIINAFVSDGISITSFGGLDAHVAAALESAALGGKANTIDESVRQDVKDWLHGSGSHVVDADIRSSLTKWVDATDGASLPLNAAAGLAVYVPLWAQIAAESSLAATVDGIVAVEDLVKGEVYLDGGVRASLLSYLADVGLDEEVKVGLTIAAVGGAVTSLTDDVKSALEKWLASSDAEIDGSLKTSVLDWLHGTVAEGVDAVDTLAEDAVKIESVGGYVASRVVSGALSNGTKSSLQAWLDTDLAHGVDDDILETLKHVAKGELATTFSHDVRTALAVWIHSDDCPLTKDLRSVVLLWLSHGAAADRATVQVAKSDADTIQTFLKSDKAHSLSLDVIAALGALSAGQSLATVYGKVWAQVAGLLGGSAGVGVGLGVEVHRLLWGWLTGCSISGE